MSFQAYLDAVRKKTGKSPEDFRNLAQERGYLRSEVKAGEVVAWLKSEFGLGHGHAMAIYGTIRSTVEPKLTTEQRIAAHFSGRRADWKSAYDRIIAIAGGSASGVNVKPTDSYISLLRDDKKFAIVKVTIEYLDVGIKLKGAKSGPRLQPAGDWNRMVTHRVRLISRDDIDDELGSWLREAYEQAFEKRSLR